MFSCEHPLWQVTVQLLQSLLSDSSSASFPWEAVHHITGEICYGGRVTDQRDLICMKALLRKFCSQEMIEECYVEGSKVKRRCGIRMPLFYKVLR